MDETEAGRYEELPFPGEPLTPFTGRESELTRLGSLLVECELVCVHGPVGIGKHRLCRETARTFADAFPDGVAEADFESLRSRQRIVATLAHSAGLSFYSDSDKLHQLASYLHGRRMLLLCGGLEDFDGLDELLDGLLDGLGETVMLFTRSRPLEHEMVANLGLSGVACRGAEGMPAAGCDLLVQAFKALHEREPGANLTDDLERLCHMLRGNPMALELAAAVLGGLPMESLESDLADRLAKPTGSGAEISHHFIVQAMLEILWANLSREERGTARQLSVFSGPFPLEQARELTGCGQGIFRSLAESGMLRVAGPDKAFVPGPVRDFAFERLSELEQRLKNTRDRHCDIYMSFLARQAEAMRSGRRRRAFDDIAAQRRDVRKAWLWALESGRTEMVAQGMDGLTGFYEAGSLFSQGVQTFRSAVDLLRRLHSHHEDLDIEELLAMAQSRLGWFLFHTGKMDEAEEILSRSLFILRHCGNLGETALTLNYLGTVFQYGGRVREAADQYDEALKLSRSCGDTEGVARALNNVGIAAAIQGDYGRAEGSIEKFLEMSQRTGNRINYSKALGNLGLIHQQTERLDSARETFEKQLELNRELGAPLGMANSFHHLAGINQRLGNHEEALRLARMALEIREDIGDRRRAVITRGEIARILLSLNRPEEAWDAIEAVMDEAPESGFWLEYLALLNVAARAANAAERPGRAWQLTAEGIEIAMERGTRPALLNLLATAALILMDHRPRPAALIALTLLRQNELRTEAAKTARELRSRARSELDGESYRELKKKAMEGGLAPLLREIRALKSIPGR